MIEYILMAGRTANSSFSISDNFNRSDGGLGANWITLTGASAPSISSDQVSTPSGIGEAYYNSSPTSNNQTSTIDVISVPSFGFVGVLLRASSSANTAYVGQIYVDGDGNPELLIRKIIAGSFTDLATLWIGSCSNPDDPDPTSCANDDETWTPGAVPVKIRLNVTGTSLSIDTFDGSVWTISVLSVTDSSITSGFIGILCGSGGILDNFLGGTL
jgi:hypothetical protein